MNRQIQLKQHYIAPQLLGEYRAEYQGVIADSFGTIGGGEYEDGEWD